MIFPHGTNRAKKPPGASRSSRTGRADAVAAAVSAAGAVVLPFAFIIGGAVAVRFLVSL